MEKDSSLYNVVREEGETNIPLQNQRVWRFFLFPPCGSGLMAKSNALQQVSCVCVLVLVGLFHLWRPGKVPKLQLIKHPSPEHQSNTIPWHNAAGCKATRFTFGRVQGWCRYHIIDIAVLLWGERLFVCLCTSLCMDFFLVFTVMYGNVMLRLNYDFPLCLSPIVKCPLRMIWHGRILSYMLPPELIKLLQWDFT